MRRVLLVSTAVLGLASLPALAQQAEPVPPAVTGGAAAPAEAPSAATTAGAPAPQPIPEQAEHQVRAQSLLGVDVSNGQDTIGEVSDLVVTDDGRVEAIVVGSAASSASARSRWPWPGTASSSPSRTAAA